MEHLTSNKAKKNVCLGVTMCYPIIAIYFGKWWKMKITSGASRFSIISRQTHLETPVLLTFGNLGVSQFTLRLSKPMGRRAVPTNAGRTQAATSAVSAVSAEAVAAGMRGRRDIDGSWTWENQIYGSGVHLYFNVKQWGAGRFGMDKATGMKIKNNAFWPMIMIWPINGCTEHNHQKLLGNRKP